MQATLMTQRIQQLKTLFQKIEDDRKFAFRKTIPSVQKLAKLTHVKDAVLRANAPAAAGQRSKIR